MALTLSFGVEDAQLAGQVNADETQTRKGD